jgi:hypothetical protein
VGQIRDLPARQPYQNSGIAVQQNDERPMIRPGLRHMEAHSVRHDVRVPDHRGSEGLRVSVVLRMTHDS